MNNDKHTDYINGAHALMNQLIDICDIKSTECEKCPFAFIENDTINGCEVVMKANKIINK